MGICKEKAVKYGPLSHRCSRIIPSPADCQGKFGPANTYLIDALLPQMGTGKARGAQFGHSKSGTGNTAWP